MTTHRNTQGNVLLVANYDSDIGYAWWLMESFWVALALHFKAQGRESYLVFPKLRTLSDRLIESSIIPMELDFSDRSKSGLSKLRSFIKGKSIKIVYLTDRPYMDWFYMLLRHWGVRLIINHDHTPGERPSCKFPKKIIKTVLHQFGIFSCDHYIGVSQFVHNRFIRNVCIPPSRCSFVHNGIVPIPLPFESRAYARNIFSIPENASIVVSTGRATIYKGLDFFIKCAEEIIKQRRRNHVYFLHCGDGPYLQECKELVRERGLEHQVIFAGRRNDVIKILPSCDIAIQTSIGEAFSLSVLEYLSAGLPTIAPNNCGHGEVIVDGLNGFLYVPRDLKNLADLIENLLDNPQKRYQFSESGQKTVKENFNLDHTLADLVQTVNLQALKIN